jgi:cell division protein ZapA
MSNVTLTICGRDYTVACAAGEEAHVMGLGRMIDSKLEAMGNMAGQSETRQLLFAALLLADQLHEAGPAPAAVATGSTASDDVSADRLESIAARLENCASHLEG